MEIKALLPGGFYNFVSSERVCSSLYLSKIWQKILSTVLFAAVAGMK